MGDWKYMLILVNVHAKDSANCDRQGHAPPFGYTVVLFTLLFTLGGCLFSCLLC